METIILCLVFFFLQIRNEDSVGLHVFVHREHIRKGLEELQGVRPGGDTFMHEGILRVRVVYV